MTPRRALGLVAALGGLGILAYLLRNVVSAWVILPLAQLFWWLQIFYRAVPQVVYWVILLVILIYLPISGFLALLPELRASRNPGGFRIGEVQQVAHWLSHRGRGIFSRWRVANLLGKIALEILSPRPGSGRKDRPLSGPGWNPPQNVQDYLEAALTTNYADYPRRGIFSGEPHTPFDSDPEPIVDYLETLLEDDHDHQHS